MYTYTFDLLLCANPLYSTLLIPLHVRFTELLHHSVEILSFRLWLYSTLRLGVTSIRAKGSFTDIPVLLFLCPTLFSINIFFQKSPEIKPFSSPPPPFLSLTIVLIFFLLYQSTEIWRMNLLCNKNSLSTSFSSVCISFMSAFFTIFNAAAFLRLKDIMTSILVTTQTNSGFAILLA